LLVSPPISPAAAAPGRQPAAAARAVRAGTRLVRVVKLSDPVSPVRHAVGRRRRRSAAVVGTGLYARAPGIAAAVWSAATGPAVPGRPSVTAAAFSDPAAD
ncbi:unnamed protein product, partial [Ectocarpus sp. 12 AP-2014]